MNSKDINPTNSFDTSNTDDSCLRSPRYPLANDSTASVFGGDDCLQPYGEFGIDNFTSPETFIDAQGAINIAISVTGIRVPFAGQTTTFYKSLLGLLWPGHQTNQ
ncbi:hypothetical protein [Bacillus paranthracis]|uniref:Uncharacterized protein n=1 Tax=Bacillus paranthracis TaxID=2026186 RepID=A0AAJ1NFY2_9BACI|nr:hypothetical protein [Bacillus paranthracis]MDG0949895.1 hypothetical protein [Bacillus paranthracis]MDG0955682.1 hypothetical protein [Bacillus paranthracis]